MKKNKHRSATTLFDSIGSIDDRYIAEAQSYRGAAEHHARVLSTPRSRRITLVAAIAALLIITVCALPLAMRNGHDSVDAPDNSANTSSDSANDRVPSGPGNALVPDSNDPFDISPPGSMQKSAMSTLLRECAAVHEPIQSLPDLSDGQTRLIWSCDGQLYAVTLNSSECDRLLSSMREGSGSRPIRHSEQLWLCLGNGDVLSPELLPSSGNIGRFAIFDYSAELEPDEAVISCIRTILEA